MRRGVLHVPSARLNEIRCHGFGHGAHLSPMRTPRVVRPLERSECLLGTSGRMAPAEASIPSPRPLVAQLARQHRLVGHRPLAPQHAAHGRKSATSRTSWMRSMCAPASTPSATAASVPARRSRGLRLVSAPHHLGCLRGRPGEVGTGVSLNCSSRTPRKTPAKRVMQSTRVDPKWAVTRLVRQRRVHLPGDRSCRKWHRHVPPRWCYPRLSICYPGIAALRSRC